VLQTEKIKKVIISLLGKNAIGFRPDGTYAAFMVPAPPQLEFGGREQLDRIADSIVNLVGQAPHTYTQGDLQSKMQTDFPKVPGEAVAAVLRGLTLGANRIVAFDKNGKAVLTNTKD